MPTVRRAEHGYIIVSNRRGKFITHQLSQDGVQLLQKRFGRRASEAACVVRFPAAEVGRKVSVTAWAQPDRQRDKATAAGLLVGSRSDPHGLSSQASPGAGWGCRHLPKQRLTVISSSNSELPSAASGARRRHRPLPSARPHESLHMPSVLNGLRTDISRR
jgi:hypothetical protein